MKSILLSAAVVGALSLSATSASPAAAVECNTCTATTVTWTCPYELTNGWEIIVDFVDPTSGQCGSSVGCSQEACDFSGGVEFTMMNGTGGSKEVIGESGSGTGDPVANPPAQGSMAQSTRRETIGIGPSNVGRISIPGGKVDCGDYDMAGVSYAPGTCPSSCPDGAGSCSIVDAFMICENGCP